jgi:hypothetical protein
MSYLARNGRMAVKSAKSRRLYGDCRANTEKAEVRKRIVEICRKFRLSVSPKFVVRVS